MRQVTYKLPEKCCIKSVTLRETNGIDEAEAELAAEASKTKKTHEMVDLAIVKVDGNPVLPGVTGFRTWPTKTRAVVSKLNDEVNDIERTLLYPHIEKAEGEGTTVTDEGTTNIRYTFPKGLGLGFVVLREMMEADERAAALIGKNLQDEMVRRCVVKSSLGEDMSLDQIQALSTRTRAVLALYWNGMNFVDEDELAPFILEAEETGDELSAESSADASSPNGSGSQVPADAA